MIDKRFLEIMYQQWIQGNDYYSNQWMDFAEIAARYNQTTVEEILKILETCRWFKR